MLKSQRLECYGVRFSPVWCCLLILALMGIPGLFYGILVLTAGHITWVALRAYANKTVFMTHRRKLLVVPVVVLLAMLTVRPLFNLIAAFFLIWQLYHYAAQNFGICRLYDAAEKSFVPLLRRCDYAMAMLLTVLPYFATMTIFSVAISSQKHLDGYVGSAIERSMATMADLLTAFSPYAVGLFVATTVLYFAVHWVAARRGQTFSRKKLIFVGSLATAMAASWFSSIKALPILVLTLTHTVQYFAIVFDVERRNMASLIPLKPTAAAAALVVGMLGVSVLFGVVTVWSSKSADDNTVLWAVTCAGTWVNLMHFWIDSFIWKIKKAPKVASDHEAQDAAVTLAA